MKTLFFVLALLAAGNANALEITPLVGAGIEFGGDSLVNAPYSDGSRSEIEAGRGIFLRGGATAELLRTNSHALAVELAIGLKWASTKQARNGSVDWIRLPVEALAFYQNAENHFRLGAGISYQSGNNLKGSKDAAAVSTKFQDAAGLVLAGDYFLGQETNMGLGLRYTSISYQPTGATAKAKGDSLGLWFTYLIL
jgi:hypothetical protein